MSCEATGARLAVQAVVGVNRKDLEC
jgi:hypothetical protein